MQTEYAVVSWSQGRQNLLDSFSTYREAAACAQSFNTWSDTQAGDAFATVEPIGVESFSMD